MVSDILYFVILMSRSKVSKMSRKKNYKLSKKYKIKRIRKYRKSKKSTNKLAKIAQGRTQVQIKELANKRKARASTTGLKTSNPFGGARSKKLKRKYNKKSRKQRNRK